ncbi:MAG: 50S ribosomal protein L9 [Verrucomicrobiota bacterium]|jgi:large subunit ribosomal protein L9|nr:50S ribosomal protein L9 [Verrucomicrobiota bacterium]MDD8044931.1 50S ribosomal protein L9 [Verrucomicrobiota bacterium]MDD8049769.1 50S ribosomal protein L9 [Verrucomicrobiota bacterium]MDI9382740.1 50S ribosomal protein L9 [Verrucomicrobiota bacterium]HCF95545.1 50S ribosomal protein L9 [Verrucomicrobiota bacterium]
MAKEVILLKGVEGLGREGDLVEVSSGFARNFLLPQGVAMEATASARRQIEHLRKEREERERQAKMAASELANRMNSISLTIQAEAGEDGQLYGSVSAVDILAHLAKEEMDIQIERKQILLDAPIKELGTYIVEVRLHPEVIGQLKVWVTAGK